MRHAAQKQLSDSPAATSPENYDVDPAGARHVDYLLSSITNFD
jgi:hypothetical protein